MGPELPIDLDDLLGQYIPRQHQKYYLTGPSSFVPRYAPAFRPVFGS